MRARQSPIVISIIGDMLGVKGDRWLGEGALQVAGVRKGTWVASCALKYVSG